MLSPDVWLFMGPVLINLAGQLDIGPWFVQVDLRTDSNGGGGGGGGDAPAPAALGLLGIGLVAVAACRRRTP